MLFFFYPGQYVYLMYSNDISIQLAYHLTLPKTDKILCHFLAGHFF